MESNNMDITAEPFVEPESKDEMKEMKEIDIKLEDLCISRNDADMVLEQIKRNIEADQDIKSAINVYVNQYIPLEHRAEGARELLGIVQSIFNVFSGTLKNNCRVM